MPPPQDYSSPLTRNPAAQVSLVFMWQPKPGHLALLRFELCFFFDVDKTPVLNLSFLRFNFYYDC
jgi:hypothetical protein